MGCEVGVDEAGDAVGTVVAGDAVRDGELEGTVVGGTVGSGVVGEVGSGVGSLVVGTVVGGTVGSGVVGAGVVAAAVSQLSPEKPALHVHSATGGTLPPPLPLLTTLTVPAPLQVVLSLYVE